MKFRHWMRSFWQCFTAGVTASTLCVLAMSYMRPERVTFFHLALLVVITLVSSAITPLIMNAKNLLPSVWLRRLIWAGAHAALSVAILRLLGGISTATMCKAFAITFVGMALLAMPIFFLVDLVERRRIAQINAGLEKMGDAEK